MNRVLQYLNGKACTCCRARKRIEQLAEQARGIEAVTGELIEIIVPSVERLASDGPGLRAFLAWESDVVLPDNASADLAEELRALADSLIAAADALCAGGAA